MSAFRVRSRRTGTLAVVVLGALAGAAVVWAHSGRVQSTITACIDSNNHYLYVGSCSGEKLVWNSEGPAGPQGPAGPPGPPGSPAPPTPANAPVAGITTHCGSLASCTQDDFDAIVEKVLGTHTQQQIALEKRLSALELRVEKRLSALELRVENRKVLWARIRDRKSVV